MNFLARAVTGGSRFLARVAPAARFVGKYAPHAVSAVTNFASNPLVNQAANRIGVNPNVLRTVHAGASNIGAGIGLVPGVVADVRGAGAAAMNATAPARQSLAQLYRTVNG